MVSINIINETHGNGHALHWNLPHTGTSMIHLEQIYQGEPGECDIQMQWQLIRFTWFTWIRVWYCCNYFIQDHQEHNMCASPRQLTIHLCRVQLQWPFEYTTSISPQFSINDWRQCNLLKLATWVVSSPFVWVSHDTHGCYMFALSWQYIRFL